MDILEGVEVQEGLTIPLDELRFVASRSSGPGGQHVNKVSSRVTVYLDVPRSSVLTPEQKARILDRLATRISRNGELRVHAQQSRSQAANRVVALQRLGELLASALHRAAPRRKTRVSRGQRAKRLKNKRHQAEKKRTRSNARDGDE